MQFSDSNNGDEDAARSLSAKIHQRAERAREVCARVGDTAVRSILLQNLAETMVSFFMDAEYIFPFFSECF